MDQVKAVSGEQQEQAVAAQAEEVAYGFPTCRYCGGKGWKDEGDPEIGSAPMDCHVCAEKALKPATRAALDARLAPLCLPIDPSDFYGIVDAIATVLIEDDFFDNEGMSTKARRRLRMALTAALDAAPCQPSRDSLNQGSAQ